MDDGSGFDDGNPSMHFDDEDFGMAFHFDRERLHGSSGIIDPTLTTTMSPFATISAEAHFLTPPTTAPSPKSSSDYFGEPAGAGFAGPMLMDHDPFAVNDFIMFQRSGHPSTINPSATAMQTHQEVESFSQNPYPSLESLSTIEAARFSPESSTAMPESSSIEERTAEPTPSRAAPPARRRGGGRPASKRADQTDAQRAKSLERNRIAASKCRQKKKEWMQDLEAVKEEQARKRLRLRAEHWHLSQEVSNLKNALMSHAGCNDPNIKLWISQQAQNFVAKPKKTKAAKRTPLYPSVGHASKNLHEEEAEENGEAGDEDEEEEQEEPLFKTEPDFGPYCEPARGLGLGSSSAMLPSPTESLVAPEPPHDFSNFSMNLDYMPEEMLHDDQYRP